MHILLVEPAYYTRYPSLGLLKLSSYHKLRGDTVELLRGCQPSIRMPDRVYVTSLFTYAWKPVHDAIDFYKARYPHAQVTVGGIYASLCSDHLKETFGDCLEIHRGLVPEAEDLLPDYSLLPDWKASILFASRGCIRKCRFCSVPVLEPGYESKRSIKSLIYPGHTKVILWDNNILASPHWTAIFDELEELDVEVDFNQGLDARLLTQEVALRLRRLKVPVMRLAYDSRGIRRPLERAIATLKKLGVNGRRIAVYCLYNHLDTPQDFLERIRDLIGWGVVSYPMRYQSLEPAPKDSYVSPNWTREELDLVVKARRVIGYGGAFPPYEGLKRKFLDAKDFREAFGLRETRKQ